MAYGLVRGCNPIPNPRRTSRWMDGMPVSSRSPPCAPGEHYYYYCTKEHIRGRRVLPNPSESFFPISPATLTWDSTKSSLLFLYGPSVPSQSFAYSLRSFFAQSLPLSVESGRCAYGSRRIYFWGCCLSQPRQVEPWLADLTLSGRKPLELASHGKQGSEHKGHAGLFSLSFHHHHTTAFSSTFVAACQVPI